MSMFLFDKELRESTYDFISFGLWWEKDAEHKLISEIYDGEISSYYLFNFIKVWQCKN